MKAEPVILEALRTPFGRPAGRWAQTRPDALLAGVLRDVTSSAGVPAETIDDVICGCVSQAGEQGANIARQAALLAGLPDTVPGVTLNRMCGSSQQALHFAAQAVAAGDARYVLACGVESMTRVPMFLDVTLGARPFTGFDGLHPDLLARYPIPHQIESAERIAARWQLSRDALDAWSAQSHSRAWHAAAQGWHGELTQGPGGERQPRDEGVREHIDRARMAAMRPVLEPEGAGRITAANASQLADGAAAILVGDRQQALADGIRPRARFLARVVVGSDPLLQLTGVIPATERALRQAGLALADLDWIEINEAFASVVLAWLREFDADPRRVNPWGGAIAHGHPLGATGAGLMAKMLCGLEHTDGTLGLQVMCIGHGMATATVVERL